MEVYLHVGLHKTGTTYLQKKLELNLSNRDDVKCYSRSVIYKSITRPLVEEKEGEVSKKQAVDFIDELLKDKNNKLVISEENLLGEFYSWKNHCFYPQGAANLKKLSKYFPGVRFKVLLTVRNYADWIESMYLQKVKNGYATNFVSFLSKTQVENISFNSILKDIERLDCVEEVLVMDYESFKKSSDWYIKTFESFIGEKLDKSPDKDLNRSYSDKQMRMALLGNKILDKKEKAKLHEFLKRNISTDTFDKPNLFSSEEREKMTVRYLEDLSSMKSYSASIDNVEFQTIANPW